MTLGYRTIYAWQSEENLMITPQTNSQPPEGQDKTGEAVAKIQEIVRSERPKASP